MHSCNFVFLVIIVVLATVTPVGESDTRPCRSVFTNASRQEGLQHDVDTTNEGPVDAGSMDDEFECRPGLPNSNYQVAGKGHQYDEGFVVNSVAAGSL